MVIVVADFRDGKISITRRCKLVTCTIIIDGNGGEQKLFPEE